MKIALVIERYDAAGGGAERWTDRHARQLVGRGHEVHLFARSFRGAPLAVVCHFVDPASSDFWNGKLAFADAAEKALSRDAFDVIHDMGSGWRCDVFMPHHGVRAAGYEQNTRLAPAWTRPLRGLARQLPRYRAFDALERRQYDASNDRLYVAVSNMVADHFVEYHQTPRSRIRVIHNGVDTKRFRPPGRLSAREPVRRRLNLDGQVVFLLVAHNFRLKGLATLIEALAIVRRHDSRATLVVAGNDTAAPFQSLAQRLGCESAVRFVGDVEDPRDHYHAADVYAQPTFYDPCSLVVLEALACGLPVITTAHNGAGELISPGREGQILADPTDASALASAMGAYLDSSPRAAAGAAARALAERHDQAVKTEEYLALYGEKLARHAA